MNGEELKNTLGYQDINADHYVYGNPVTYSNSPYRSSVISGSGPDSVLNYDGRSNIIVTIDNFSDPQKVATVTHVAIGYQDYTGVHQVYDVGTIMGSGSAFGDQFHVGGVSYPLTTIDGNVHSHSSTPLYFDISESAVNINLIDGIASTEDWSLSFKNFWKFIGSPGDDTFILKAEDEYHIIGGGGNDTADYSQSLNAVNLSTAVQGRFYATGPSGIANFIGTDMNDTFRFVDGGHKFDGRGGVDTVDYSGSQSAIEFDGKTGKVGPSSTDELTNIEKILGTGMNDVFRGGDKMTFVGNGGVDTFHTGRGGSTYLPGDIYVNDVMIADDPFVIHLRTPGVTTQDSGIVDSIGNVAKGISRLTGSTGDDVVDVGSGAGDLPSTIEGGGGMDTLHLLGGMSYNYGGLTAPGSSYGSSTVSGFSRFYLDSGNFFGTGVSEEIHGGVGTQNIYGGGGNDRIYAIADLATPGRYVSGGDDNDQIWSGGFDAIYGDGGNDTLYTGLHTLYADGGSGNDVIHAEAAHVGTLHVSDQSGTNRIFAAPGIEVDFSFGSYNQLNRVHDVGGGIFEVDMTNNGVIATTFVSGVDHINIYMNGVASQMPLYTGLDFFG